MRGSTAVACTAVFVAGCGAGGTRAAAVAGTRTLNWVDAAGPRGSRVVVAVSTLTVGPAGWRVRAKVTNGTAVSLAIARIHGVSRARFGIAELGADARAMPAQLVATRFTPPLPGTLAPGASWAGEFSGRGPLPAGPELHVVVGTFFAIPPIVIGRRRFARFNVYSDESVRLR